MACTGRLVSGVIRRHETTNLLFDIGSCSLLVFRGFGANGVSAAVRARVRVARCGFGLAGGPGTVWRRSIGPAGGHALRAPGATRRTTTRATVCAAALSAGRATAGRTVCATGVSAAALCLSCATLPLSAAAVHSAGPAAGNGGRSWPVSGFGGGRSDNFAAPLGHQSRRVVVGTQPGQQRSLGLFSHQSAVRPIPVRRLVIQRRHADAAGDRHARPA